jgi:hypothetical protein
MSKPAAADLLIPIAHIEKPVFSLHLQHAAGIGGSKVS